MERNNKIEKVFLEKLKANGGHWVLLTTKATCKNINVRRLGLSSFENPHLDTYEITVEIANRTQDDRYKDVSFNDLINFLSNLK